MLVGFAQKYDALMINPTTVTPNNKIAFTYNSALTALNNKKNISIAIYAFTKKDWVVIEPKTTQVNKEVKGSFFYTSGNFVSCFYCEKWNSS